MTARNRKIEDAYPLAPIQQGLLFHTLESPDEGVFVAQYTCLLRHLEADRFEAAWQRVVDRHPVLRTAFVWKKVDTPLQVVGREVGLPVTREDWRDVPAEAMDERVEDFLRRDRRRGFDPSRAPLMRLALLQVDADAWRFVWTFHHLILDGWCRSVLLREVFQVYAASLGGGDADLAPPRPYREYVGWLQQQDREQATEFWRRALAGLDASTPLPTGHGRAAAGEGYGSLEAHLDEAASAALGELARRNRLTLNTVAQGAWALLLSRWTGRADVVYGAVVSGRPAELPGVERMIGVFINTLPMRLAVTPGERLVPWLQGLQERLAEMRHYEHSALVDIQKASDLPHGEPLFRSILAFENYPFEAADAGESHDVALEVEGVRSIVRNAYPLAWAVSPGPNLHLRLLYERAWFADETAQTILTAYASLLRQMARDPEASLGAFALVAADEATTLVGELAVAETAPAQAGTVLDVFLQHASERPANMAVVGDDAVWTYAELDAVSSRLAHRLRAAGAGPEAAVALLLPRGAWTVAAMLAAWKAGAAYVALDDELPMRRLAGLVGDAGARLLVGRGEALAELADATEVVAIDLDREDLSEWPATAPERPADPAHLAYVLFTSGSSGRPKGVAVEHRQLAHYADAIGHRLGVEPGLSYALVSSFAADLGNTGLLLALTTGGSLMVAGAAAARDPGALADFLERHPVDVLKIVPSHLAALTDGGRGRALMPRRALVLGGEAADPRRLEEWRRWVPDCAVFNHYGPTEATVGAVAGEVRGAGSDGEMEAPPLGRPLARTRAYVVDAAGQPLPVGVAGELWIGGAGLARGYHAAAAATADRFRPDRWSPQPGGRVYRTGDRVCWLPDGNLRFLGRTDLQVKVRGYRVEPQEVERLLEAHPLVGRAAVAAAEDGAGRLGLDAYAVPLDPRLADAEALRDALWELPDGQAFYQLNRNETLHLYEQIYSDDIYRRHGITVEDGACVFDVGANVGMFSVWVHRVSRGARVFAFEPSPTAHARLRLNAALYGLDVTALQCGVSDHDGSAELTVYPRASVMSGFYADPAEEEAVFRGYMESHETVSAYAEHADELAEGRFEGESVEVTLRSLSSVIREHRVPRIDVLKVDAEKAELDVFRGLDAEHWPLVRQVTAEVHDVGDRIQEIRDLLTGHGFAVFLEQDDTLVDTGIFHLYAHRPETAASAESERAPARLETADAGLAAADLAASLREFAEARLPEYMVPRSFTPLEALPTLPSGKVDRRGLPDPAQPEAAAERGYVAPRNELEQTLADIWAEVLKLERVGVEDDFFRLGGDSILNIQIVARGLRAGLKLNPGLLFRHPTVAQLAQALSDGGAAPAAAEAVEERPQGEVPLTPVQRWFLDDPGPAPHHFNMPVFLEVRRPLEPAPLAAAFAALGEHHDALRLRFERGDGGWVQRYAEEAPRRAFSWIDLSALPVPRRTAALEAAAARSQGGFDLARGPLLRGLLFHLAAGQPSRLLLLAHHLVVDGVSWRILLEDLETAYGRFAAGETEAGLPPRSASFQRWACALEELAASSRAEAARRYWLDFAGQDLPPLPVDREDGDNLVSSAETVRAELDAATTEALLTAVPAAYNTGVQEVLLTALVESVAELTGRRRLAVEAEGHGREDVVEGVDVTRTVGWFTSHYPLLLDTEGADGPGNSLKRVKEQVRSLPLAGLGHGVLRHLSPDDAVRERLATAPRPEIKFNYLGRLDQVLPTDSLFAAATEDAGRSSRGDQARSHLLYVTGAVANHTLEVLWQFSARRHERSTIQALVKAFVEKITAIVDHCQHSDVVGYTPSDFPEAGLSQGGLDSLVAQLGGPDES